MYFFHSFTLDPHTELIMLTSLLSTYFFLWCYCRFTIMMHSFVFHTVDRYIVMWQVVLWQAESGWSWRCLMQNPKRRSISGANSTAQWTWHRSFSVCYYVQVLRKLNEVVIFIQLYMHYHYLACIFCPLALLPKLIFDQNCYLVSPVSMIWHVSAVTYHSFPW